MNSGFVVWLSGLPGSGKTTLAHALRQELADRGISSAIIEGEALRSRLGDPGYNDAGREMNVLRASQVAQWVVEGGGNAIVAMVSPKAAPRELATMRLRQAGYQVYEYVLVAPYAVLEQRRGAPLWPGTEYEAGSGIRLDATESVSELASTILGHVL